MENDENPPAGTSVAALASLLQDRIKLAPPPAVKPKPQIQPQIIPGSTSAPSISKASCPESNGTPVKPPIPVKPRFLNRDRNCSLVFPTSEADTTRSPTANSPNLPQCQSDPLMCATVSAKDNNNTIVLQSSFMESGEITPTADNAPLIVVKESDDCLEDGGRDENVTSPTSDGTSAESSPSERGAGTPEPGTMPETETAPLTPETSLATKRTLAAILGELKKEGFVDDIRASVRCSKLKSAIPSDVGAIRPKEHRGRLQQERQVDSSGQLLPATPDSGLHNWDSGYHTTHCNSNTASWWSGRSDETSETDTLHSDQETQEEEDIERELGMHDGLEQTGADADVEVPKELPDDARKRKMQHAAQEILSTEKTHLKQCKLLGQAFPEYIKMYASKLDQPVYQGPVLDNLRKQFAPIITVHESLLKEFDVIFGESSDQTQCARLVSDVLRTHAPFLRVCAEFVRAKSAMAAQLTEGRRQWPNFRDACVVFERNFFHGIPLSNQLDIVHQRLARYPLLLHACKKYADTSGGEEAESIERAIKATEAAVHKIDQECLSCDGNELLEAARRLQGQFEVFHHTRRLIKHGPVLKQSRKNMNSRYLYLFSDCLLCCRPATTSVAGGALKLRYEIWLQDEKFDVKARQEPDFKKHFMVLSFRRSLEFITRDAHDRDGWVRSIRETRKELLEGRRSFDMAKRKKVGTKLPFSGHGPASPTNKQPDSQQGQNSVAQLEASTSQLPQRSAPLPPILGEREPVWEPDRSVSMCRMAECDSKFKTMSLSNRRHHCRLCGRDTHCVEKQVLFGCTLSIWEQEPREEDIDRGRTTIDILHRNQGTDEQRLLVRVKTTDADSSRSWRPHAGLVSNQPSSSQQTKVDSQNLSSHKKSGDPEHAAGLARLATGSMSKLGGTNSMLSFCEMHSLLVDLVRACDALGSEGHAILDPVLHFLLSTMLRRDQAFVDLVTDLCVSCVDIPAYRLSMSGQIDAESDANWRVASDSAPLPARGPLSAAARAYAHLVGRLLVADWPPGFTDVYEECNPFAYSDLRGKLLKLMCRLSSWHMAARGAGAHVHKHSVACQTHEQHHDRLENVVLGGQPGPVDNNAASDCELDESMSVGNDSYDVCARLAGVRLREGNSP